MGIKLEKGLPHQQRAIDALNAVFENVYFRKPEFGYQNPLVDLNSVTLVSNLKALKDNLPYKVENKIQIDKYSDSDEGRFLNLDIKMETGTGKTYVYTQTIYELHKKYGYSKFIILVPSLAIKYGTTSFIDSIETRRHFREIYGTEVEVNSLDAKKNTKEVFPNSIRGFVSTSNIITSQISVLITNMHLFKERSFMTKQFSNGVEDFFTPSEAVFATRPVVIIDEPHRFSKDGETYKFLMNRIRPQIIIRFGATFPESKGKIKDYTNLIYNLGSCDSFNQNLIKGVMVQHLASPDGTKLKLKLKSIEKGKRAYFILIDNKTNTIRELERYDNLGLVHPSFSGVTVEGIFKDYVELSNGVEMRTNMEIYADIYSSSYQEVMIKEALNSHFETEKKNFLRVDQIKTLALFFIDDIDSYRENGLKIPYLKNIFESLLKTKIESEISKLDTSVLREKQYRDYLEATLTNISKSHGGYFSKDNSSSDEDIADEVNRILKDKEKTLAIYVDGKPNIFRFIFSKWTLKEGWDNPNIFTIAKLRSSGSEISKIQEVGRGLRLPVNNSLSRVSSEQFYLNYIVDFTEEDFANRLVDEINGELNEHIILSREIIEKVAGQEGKTYGSFLGFLIDNDFVDDNKVVNTDKRDSLFMLYPDLATGLDVGKVIDVSKTKMKNVRIIKTNYDKLKVLWKVLNTKYFISYTKLDDTDIQLALTRILEDGIDVKQEIIVETKIVDFNILSEADISAGAEKVYQTDNYMKYNDFIVRASKNTNVPIKIVHNSFVQYATIHKIEKTLFNQRSLAYFIDQINNWKRNTLLGKFKYTKIDLTPESTSLNDSKWNANKTITQGLLGRMIDEKSTPPINYLYDLCVYDSKIEKDNIMCSDPTTNVEVFGKIPKSSIRIPIIDGSSYSPDFMYIVKTNDKVNEINLVIESKGYDREEDIPVDDAFKIKCAEVFFKQMVEDGINVEFKTQINTSRMIDIIRKLRK